MSVPHLPDWDHQGRWQSPVPPELFSEDWVREHKRTLAERKAAQAARYGVEGTLVWLYGLAWRTSLVLFFIWYFG